MLTESSFLNRTQATPAVDSAVRACPAALAVGLRATFTPQSAGTRYLRINDSPAELSDNSGTLQVVIEAQTE